MAFNFLQIYSKFDESALIDGIKYYHLQSLLTTQGKSEKIYLLVITTIPPLPGFETLSFASQSMVYCFQGLCLPFLESTKSEPLYICIYVSLQCYRVDIDYPLFLENFHQPWNVVSLLMLLPYASTYMTHKMTIKVPKKALIGPAHFEK